MGAGIGGGCGISILRDIFYFQPSSICTGVRLIVSRCLNRMWHLSKQHHLPTDLSLHFPMSLIPTRGVTSRALAWHGLPRIPVLPTPIHAHQPLGRLGAAATQVMDSSMLAFLLGAAWLPPASLFSSSDTSSLISLQARAEQETWGKGKRNFSRRREVCGKKFALL